jgi:hypothetical protein
MSVRVWKAILAVVTALAIFGVMAAIFQVRFFFDVYLMASTVLLIVTVMAFFALGARPAQSEAGWLGSIGVRFTFLVIALVLNVLAVVFAIIALGGLSIAADILALLSVVFSIGLGQVTSKMVTEANTAADFPSQHLDWQDDLQRITVTFPTPEVSTTIGPLAERSRFLARDFSREGLPVDATIAETIVLIRGAAESKNSKELSALAVRLDQLMNEREMVLKSRRRKV